MDTASQRTLMSDHDKFFNDMWKEFGSELGAKDLAKIREVIDRTALEAFVEEVRGRSMDYKDGTKSKTKRVRVRMQRICQRLSEFLDYFAGIAEVAKGINQRGGALGYGALSMLLMLVRNKQDREDKIGSYLDRAKGYLKDLGDWQAIYESRECSSLTTAILEVYREILRFVMSTWRYYNGRSRDRWLSALCPAKYSIHQDLENLEAVVRSVKAETDKEVHRQLRDMEQDRLDKKQRKWKHRCELIRHCLKCPGKIDPSTRSQQLEEELQALVEDDPATYTAMQAGTLRALEEKQEYIEWRDSRRGGMLLIWALNHWDAGPRTSNWLSPALTELALLMRQREERVIVHVVQSARETPYALLALIVCEILEWDQSFFTSQKERLDIAWEGGTTSSPAKLLSLAKYLLSQWTSTHPDEHINIILDGIDKWVQREENLLDGTPWRVVMEELLDCVKDSGVRVCVLAEWCEWRKDVERIMTLKGSHIRLRDGAWHTVCLRQGNRGIME
ncbi:hypothetical protein K469DRAFT_215223 [Zopfia rhizophila CBS 207.26]|uniref:DUF7708 domain-containing protein n=1 Tax=Zopfia rhizophila CBS 207.26 TaxID=1314779 RepID=A0A6A6DY43_9PEZI|nr:hypothetical protein K469DRAFT_215223 [Zopfia rhizophila CBS 207.26]